MPLFGPVTVVRSLFSTLLLLSVPSLGCDSGGDAKVDAAEAEAKKADAEKKKARAERKQKRLDADKAKLDAVDKQKDDIDKLCVLPEKLPKKLAKACEAVGVAQDGFMRRLYGSKPETVAKWEAGKAMQTKMTVDNCLRGESIEVAACQRNALEKAPEALKKQLPDFLRRCAKKFGKGGGAAPSMPPKKAPAVPSKAK